VGNQRQRLVWALPARLGVAVPLAIAAGLLMSGQAAAAGGAGSVGPASLAQQLTASAEQTGGAAVNTAQDAANSAVTQAESTTAAAVQSAHTAASQALAQAQSALPSGGAQAGSGAGSGSATPPVPASSGGTVTTGSGGSASPVIRVPPVDVGVADASQATPGDPDSIPAAAASFVDPGRLDGLAKETTAAVASAGPIALRVWRSFAAPGPKMRVTVWSRDRVISSPPITRPGTSGRAEFAWPLTELSPSSRPAAANVSRSTIHHARALPPGRPTAQTPQATGEAPATPAWLGPGVGGPAAASSAGSGAGPALALLAWAAIALLLALSSRRLSLDLPPPRSALAAGPPERPG
jgi:hypothetical protein